MVKIIKLLVGSVSFGFLAWLNVNFLEKILTTDEFAKYTIVNELSLLLVVLFEGAYTYLYVMHSKGKLVNHLVQRLALTSFFFILLSIIVYYIYGEEFLSLYLLSGILILLQVITSTLMLKMHVLEQFFKYSIVKNIPALIRSIGLLLIFIWGVKEISTNELIYYFSFISLFLLLPLLKSFNWKEVDLSVNALYSNSTDIIKYTVLSGSSILLTKVDLFFLGAISTSKQVSIFVICLSYIKLLSILTTSLNSYLIKYSSDIDSKLSFLSFIKKSILISLSFIVLIFFFYLAFPLIVSSIGYEYPIDSYIQVFKVLILASILELIFIPLMIICTKFNMLKVLLYSNFLFLIINSFANYLLIPEYGALGASYSTLMVRIFGGILVFYLVVRKYAKFSS